MKNGSEKFWGIANRVYEKILTVFCVLILLLGVYMLLDVMYLSHHTRESIRSVKPDVINADTLKAISEEAVGWITLDDTGIDYPVMQAKNNLDYLNKDPKGTYSLTGSIFMDYRCASDFTDAYSLIYGHHADEGLMFGALDDYQDKAFAETHSKGTLYTKDGAYKVQVLAYCNTTTDCDEIFNLDPSIERKDYLKTNSTYYFRGNETSHLLALTTCKDVRTTARTALILSVVR